MTAIKRRAQHAENTDGRAQHTAALSSLSLLYLFRARFLLSFSRTLVITRGRAPVSGRINQANLSTQGYAQPLSIRDRLSSIIDEINTGLFDGSRRVAA